MQYRSNPMNAVRTRGFTLVELLVVISIIVLLISLLAPALDKAIYQAELVQCGATEKVLATAAINYAFDNKKLYPDPRPDGSNGSGIWRQNSLILQVGGEVNYLDPRPGQNFDLRPYYIPRQGQSGAQYLGAFKSFVDPVTHSIDVSYDANDPDCQIFSDYHLNAGWGPSGQGWMRKLGQGFTWNEHIVNANASDTVREIHVLVSDKSEVQTIGGVVSKHAGSSHPDDAGILTFGSRQNTDNGVNPASPQNRAQDLWPKKTISGFGSADTRGGLSNNYAFDDGSVRRYDNVTIRDERMFLVPHENAIAGTGTLPTSVGDPRRTQVPSGN